MNLLTVSTDLISIFLFTTLFLFFARKVAKKVGLVDKPNFRKRHQGLIPLVGGISVYAGICFTFGIVDYYIPHASLYLACAGVLVFIGALDDRFDISVKIRATIQAAVGIVMMVFGKLYLSSLGYIFGSWEMVLGPFGYFLTLFAVWAAINAFNMVDGIDGLLGGLSCVSFAAIGMILWFDGQTSLAIWCFAMIAAILPYIMLNLGILGRRYKVFMGDAGSTLIGFTVIWILLETTQGKTHPISPVTALWIIAIPLMDMVAIMYRRLRKGMSPFSPDRQHIHHLIMRAGFTSRQAFVLITLAAALLASIGVLAEYSHFVPEWVMLVLFLLAFFLYGYCIKRAWKVARQEWSSTAITDRPTVNMLGGYYSQQQFLRNLDVRSNMASADQPSVMDEAYKEFVMQLASWDTRREFWLQTDYYKQRMVGNSKADAALLDEMINNIVFIPGDFTRAVNDSVKLIAETAPDANNLLRQYVAFASQRAASHLNDELKGAWAARTIQMKAQVKRQEEVAKAIYDRRMNSIEQALKIAEQHNISRSATDVPAEELPDSEMFLLGRPMLQARLENLQAVGPAFDLDYDQNRAMLNTLNVGPTLDPRFQTYRYLRTPEEPVKRDSPRRAFLMIMWGIVGGLIGAGVALTRRCSK